MTATAFILRQLPCLRVAVVTETYPLEVNGVDMTLGRQTCLRISLSARMSRGDLLPD